MPTIKAEELGVRHKEFLSEISSAMQSYRTGDFGTVEYRICAAQLSYEQWFQQRGVKLVFEDDKEPPVDNKRQALANGVVDPTIAFAERHFGESYGPSALSWVRHLCYRVATEIAPATARTILSTSGGVATLADLWFTKFDAVAAACLTELNNDGREECRPNAGVETRDETSREPV